MILQRIVSAITRTERNKINQNFDILEKGYTGLQKGSNKALEEARKAKEKSESTAKQLEDVIIESGTSDAEVIASRTDTEYNETYPSLSSRLDSQHKDVKEKVDKTYDDALYYYTTELENQKIRDENNNFRISTFNIKSMRTFDNRGIQLAKQTINLSGSDICCTQESLNGLIFNYNNKMTSSTFGYSAFSNIVENYVQGANYGVAAISDVVINNPTTTLYNMLATNYERRGFQRFEVTLGSKVLAVYNTHLSYEDVNLTESQINELYAAVSADSATYKVILGDMNTSDLSLFSPFTNGGYVIQNDGTYITFKPSNTAIDNIITSPNIVVDSKGIIESGDESDHNLFYIEFNLGG